MAYTKTTWVNGTAPALNATNLNKIEQGIFDSVSKTAAVAGVNLNTVIVSGMYRVDAVTGLPAGASDYGQLLVLQAGGDTISQTYYDFANFKTYIRNGTVAGGIVVSAGGWKEVAYYDANFGIVVGSNANGQYTKFPDGTMICSHALSSSSSANTTWTYPQTFQTFVFAQVTAESPTIGVLVGQIYSRTFTELVLNVLNASGARVACTTHVLAVGRWKP